LESSPRASAYGRAKRPAPPSLDRRADDAIEGRLGDDLSAVIEDEIDPEALGRLHDGEILGLDLIGEGTILGIARDERR